MRKSLFCLFLFVMTLPAFSDEKITVDTQIAWNSQVVVEAIKPVSLDQNTSNRILVDLLDRDKFSVGDAVRVCRSYCDQSKALQLYQGDCPAVCEQFGKNLVLKNNENAVTDEGQNNDDENTEGESDKKAAIDCPDGTYDIGIGRCVDPAIDGTKYSYSDSNMTWETVFSYGDVLGVAVCNNTSGSWGDSSPNDMQETGGKNCWCKMTHPAVSLWVFRNAGSSSSDCAGSCANDCGDSVRISSDFRSAVFSSVGQ